MTRVRVWENKFIWIALAVSVVILVAAVVFGNNQRIKPAAAAPAYATLSVRQGDLEASVVASGTVAAINDLPVTFQVSGVVSQVLITPGQVVKKDEPLAYIDSRDLQLSLNTAESNLKAAQAKLELVKATSAKDLITAEANYKQAQTRLAAAQAGTTSPADLAAAQATLDKAQADFNSLNTSPKAADIAAAQADLTKAQANLAKLQAGPDAQAIKQAEAALGAAVENRDKTKSNLSNDREKARINRDKAQSDFDKADAAYKKIYNDNHNPDGSLKPDVKPDAITAETNAKNALDDAKTKLDLAKSDFTNADNQAVSGGKEADQKVAEAQAKLDQLKLGPGAQALQAAQADVDKARAFLTKAQQGPTQGQIDAAVAEINRAKANLEKLKQPPSPKDIEIAQNEVNRTKALLDNLNTGPNVAELNQATAGVEGANSSLQQARLRLDQATLRAPFNGVVAAINMIPGQSVGFVAAGAATSTAGTITVVDLSGLQVRVLVSETDISKLQAGQAARVNVDVASKTPFTGLITYVAPKASVFGSNQLAYPITVQLDSSAAVSGTATTDPLAVGVRPGMGSRVTLITDRRSNTLAVPNNTLRKLEDGTTVVDLMTEAGNLVTVPIKPGLSNERETEVLAPALLSKGDKLIVQTASATPTPTASGTPSSLILPIVTTVAPGSPTTAPNPTTAANQPVPVTATPAANP